MQNQCNFIGRLGKDPEVKTMQSGDKVANLSIACTEKWKDKQGERKESTTWVPVVVWGPLAGIVEQYVHKGSLIAITGKFRVRKWADQSGQDRYSTEIVLQGPQAQLTMLDSKPADGAARSSGGASDGGWHTEQYSGPSKEPLADDLDDEIPF